MRRFLSVNIFLLYFNLTGSAQLQWQNVDSLYQPLPASVHVYKTTDTLDGKPNIAYCLIADLKDRKLDFTTDTTYRRRLTPSKFYEKNDKPLLVVNTTFFSFATHQNLNVVIKNKKLVGYNIHSLPGKGKDTLTYRHPFGSAIGISKKRTADVAWLYTDSTHRYAYALNRPVAAVRDSLDHFPPKSVRHAIYPLPEPARGYLANFTKWKMKTAVGGGPVLLQSGEIMITNNEELKFAGKAIDDKHPRTAMGYTADQRLIILVVQGRFPGLAEGATLLQLAKMLKNLGCVEALNLDGGGSSCMLINGAETIKPSDKEGQRAIPGVLLIKRH